jgi:hypothetical protein
MYSLLYGAWCKQACTGMICLIAPPEPDLHQSLLVPMHSLLRNAVLCACTAGRIASPV